MSLSNPDVLLAPETDQEFNFMYLYFKFSIYKFSLI